MKLCREIYDASVLIDASPSRYYRPDITTFFFTLVIILSLSVAYVTGRMKMNLF